MSYNKFSKIDDENLQIYLRDISKIPQISVGEEKELGRRIQEQGDEEALQKLVESNLRFVVSYAKKYKDGPISLADLIEEGNTGLIEAAKRFDPGKDVKFITYAAWWIRQAIIHAFGEQGRTIRLPQRQANLLYQLGKNYSHLRNALDRNPTSEELANRLQITTRQADDLLQFRREELSLDASFDEDSETEIGSLVEEKSIPPVDIALIKESFEHQVREIIAELSERERLVIEERFGFNENQEPQTLQKIGEKLGITRERVRQIEQQAIEKLRRQAKCRKLQTFLN